MWLLPHRLLRPSERAAVHLGFGKHGPAQCPQRQLHESPRPLYVAAKIPTETPTDTDWAAPARRASKTEHGLSHQTITSPAVRALALATLLALGLAACGGKDKPETLAQQTAITTIGVNSYLWRASLETMQFMPLAQVDSAGGVIVGDWYQNPAVPGDRVKVTVAIMDGALRADAVQVSAQREVLENGRWVAAPVRAGTVQRLEEIILEKARGLRQAALSRD